MNNLSRQTFPLPLGRAGVGPKLLMALLASVVCLTLQAREKININKGWKFVRENVEGAEAVTFDDSRWQTVNLPHDAAVHSAFRKSGDGASARVGFLPLGRGWYRRHLTRDAAWDGQRVMLEFEGVYRDARVYVNGSICDGRHPNGYIGFRVDITDKLHEGDNLIAVSYDNTYEKSSRWYNGEGIDRNVWIHVTDPVRVAFDGTYVTTPKITGSRALVAIETSVDNGRKDSVLCRLVTEIKDPSGKVVATRTAIAPFAAGETYTFRQEIDVPQPVLWEVGNGRMYEAVSRVYAEPYPVAKTEAALTDTYTTPFGIRDIELTPDRGLLVNGKRVYINGACLHTDLGPLGTASLDAAWDARLAAITGQLGCNGIRLSHNAYPKYVLDWADRHGVLVVDEFFDKWEDSFYGRGAKMGEQQLRDIETQMRRDRNHPSVFVWSVGNETYQQIQKEKTRNGGVEMLKMLVAKARSIDPSRKTTCSQYPNRYGDKRKKNNAKEFLAADPHQFEFYTDVVSTNYLENFWDEDHRRFPQLVFMAGELAVGDLGYDYFNYDHSYPIGHFYWGGTDYIGESFGWPSKGWVRGLVDFTNRLKPLGQSVRSFYWPEPMVKLVTRPSGGQSSLVWNDLKMTWMALEEHWNYRDSDTLAVQVMSNCDETELLLNGRSLGRKALPAKDKAPELVWQLPYEKGELVAIGYNNGSRVAADTLRTAGKPARLVVTTSKPTLRADGMDLVYLDYTVVDKDGNVCPANDIRIDFSVTGCGTNAGMANANMLSDEPWQADSRTTYQGRAQLIVRSTDVPGTVSVTAKAKGLKTVKTRIQNSKL